MPPKTSKSKSKEDLPDPEELLAKLEGVIEGLEGLEAEGLKLKGLEVVRQRFQELKKEILLLKQKLEQAEAELQAAFVKAEDFVKAEEKTQE